MKLLSTLFFTNHKNDEYRYEICQDKGIYFATIYILECINDANGRSRYVWMKAINYHYQISQGNQSNIAFCESDCESHFDINYNK